MAIDKKGVGNMAIKTESYHHTVCFGIVIGYFKHVEKYLWSLSYKYIHGKETE